MKYPRMDTDSISNTISSVTSDDAAEELGGTYGASKALIFVSRVLGVLPAQASTHRISEYGEPYQPSRGNRIYSALLYLMSISLGSLTIYYRVTTMMVLLETTQTTGGEKTASETVSVDNVLLYFKLAYMLFTALFCILYAVFSRCSGDSFASVFTSLDSVDESFHFVDHTAANRRSVRHILFAALVLPLAMCDVWVLSSEFRMNNTTYVAYIGLCMHFVALSSNVIVEQQFIAFCLALRERYEHLNLHLISLQPLVYPIQDTDLNIKTSDMTLTDHFYAIARSEFADLVKYNKSDRGLLRARGVSPVSYVKTAWGADTTSDSPLSPAPRATMIIPQSGPVILKARLNLLRRVHDSLCDIMNQINGMYGVCLLASISFIFCGVLSLSYHVVTKALYPEPGGGNDVIFALVQAILWLLYLSARLIALTWACASTTKEAQRAGPLHQKLTKRTLDTSTKEELHLFSTQLLQRDIGFSVCGLFPLDFTLLYTVAGAVTTYLVILIQFQSVQPPKISAGNTSITPTIQPQHSNISITKKP